MRVLFVEDDPMNRRVVRDMLSVANVAMDEAENGLAGLSKVDQGDYDIILMDLRMPGMDGLTAIRHIREREDYKGRTPIVVVTADTAVDLRDQCLGCGADDLILKPVAMSNLFDTIGRLMASTNARGAMLA